MNRKQRRTQAKVMRGRCVLTLAVIETAHETKLHIEDERGRTKLLDRASPRHAWDWADRLLKDQGRNCTWHGKPVDEVHVRYAN